MRCGPSEREAQRKFHNSVLSAKRWFKPADQDSSSRQIQRVYELSAAKRWFKNGHRFVQVTAGTYLVTAPNTLILREEQQTK